MLQYSELTQTEGLGSTHRETFLLFPSVLQRLGTLLLWTVVCYNSVPLPIFFGNFETHQHPFLQTR